jgi:hypothetical protein
MSVEFQSFVLQKDLKLLWKKAARAERISRSEFLRRALRERAGHVLAAGKPRGVSQTTPAKDLAVSNE